MTGGPIDRIEVFEVAPTTYHIPSKFDDIVTSSSFPASFRRLNASNKGLHTHYVTNKWMNGETRPPQRLSAFLVCGE